MQELRNKWDSLENAKKDEYKQKLVHRFHNMDSKKIKLSWIRLQLLCTAAEVLRRQSEGTVARWTGSRGVLGVAGKSSERFVALALLPAGRTALNEHSFRFIEIGVYGTEYLAARAHDDCIYRAGWPAHVSNFLSNFDLEEGFSCPWTTVWPFNMSMPTHPHKGGHPLQRL